MVPPLRRSDSDARWQHDTTIGEAAKYAISLPRKIGNAPPWQRVADALHKAAEHGGPFVFMARINFYRAVYGDDPPPIGTPQSTKADKLKAKRPETQKSPAS